MSVTETALQMPMSLYTSTALRPIFSTGKAVFSPSLELAKSSVIIDADTGRIGVRDLFAESLNAKDVTLDGKDLKDLLPTNLLTYDFDNMRLGVNRTVPLVALDVGGSGALTGELAAGAGLVAPSLRAKVRDVRVDAVDGGEVRIGSDGNTGTISIGRSGRNQILIGAPGDVINIQGEFSIGNYQPRVFDYTRPQLECNWSGTSAAGCGLAIAEEPDKTAATFLVSAGRDAFIAKLPLGQTFELGADAVFAGDARFGGVLRGSGLDVSGGAAVAGALRVGGLAEVAGTLSVGTSLTSPLVTAGATVVNGTATAQEVRTGSLASTGPLSVATPSLQVSTLLTVPEIRIGTGTVIKNGLVQTSDPIAAPRLIAGEVQTQQLTLNVLAANEMNVQNALTCGGPVTLNGRTTVMNTMFVDSGAVLVTKPMTVSNTLQCDRLTTGTLSVNSLDISQNLQVRGATMHTGPATITNGLLTPTDLHVTSNRNKSVVLRVESSAYEKPAVLQLLSDTVDAALETDPEAEQLHVRIKSVGGVTAATPLSVTKTALSTPSINVAGAAAIGGTLVAGGVSVVADGTAVQNVADVSGATCAALLEALRVREFDGADGRRRYGLLAQETETVAANAVTGKAVDLAGLLALAIGTIQSLTERVRTLEARLDAM